MGSKESSPPRLSLENDKVVRDYDPETPPHDAELGQSGKREEGISQENPAETQGKPRSITGFRWFLLCFGLYASCLLYGLDTTVAADIQVCPFTRSVRAAN